MPALKNLRHEAFAQAIFRGIFEPDLYPTQGAAYAAAGYTSRNIGKPGGSAEAAASQLLKKVKILDRVRELQAQAADQVKETIDKCVAELNEDRRDAKAQGQHSAAISAVMGKAKLLGLITDKQDTTVRSGDISSAKSSTDIGRLLLEGIGYAAPSAADIALACEANAHLMDTLEAIRDRALQGVVTQ
jgi:hypothetical protein